MFQRKQQCGGWKNLKITNFYKELCLSVITWNITHLSKQDASIANILEQTFLAVATFEGLWVVSIRTEQKRTCSVLWTVWGFFALLLLLSTFYLKLEKLYTALQKSYCLLYTNNIILINERVAIPLKPRAELLQTLQVAHQVVIWIFECPKFSFLQFIRYSTRASKPFQF